MFLYLFRRWSSGTAAAQHADGGVKRLFRPTVFRKPILIRREIVSRVSLYLTVRSKFSIVRRAESEIRARLPSVSAAMRVRRASRGRVSVEVSMSAQTPVRKLERSRSSVWAGPKEQLRVRSRCVRSVGLVVGTSDRTKAQRSERSAVSLFQVTRERVQRVSRAQYRSRAQFVVCVRERTDGSTLSERIEISDQRDLEAILKGNHDGQ